MSYKDDGDDDYADSKVNESEGKQDDFKSDSKLDSKEATITNDDLLAKVQEYFYCNEDLAALFETFVNERCHVVDLSSEEYKLEYTTTFNEYKRLFEDKIESFITQSLKSSVEDFYYALKAKTDELEDSSESIFAQILIAVTDFDIFMTMMREAAVAAQADRMEQSDHK